VFWFGGPGALNQHLFKVTSDRFPAWLVFEWIHQHLDEFRLIASSKATTMGHIKRGHLKEASVAVPPADWLRLADAALTPVYDLHANLSLESRKLADLRDYLLPRLLSGEIRVEVKP
jgi:type I restriction enzyme S subunit